MEAADIAWKVRELREHRRWSQVDLSRHLGLSQSRLSEIEHGDGSFTAEQFLKILSLFNVPVTHFASPRRKQSSQVQNALARLGAAQLREDPDALPSERFQEAAQLVREVLVSAESSRYLTALAPVLARDIDRINLNRIFSELLALGLERRLAWLIDNTREALKIELTRHLERQWTRRYRRAEVVLDDFLAHVPRNAAASAPDILDPEVRSTKTLEQVRASWSPISKRWNVTTAITVADFVEALRASRVGA